MPRSNSYVYLLVMFLIFIACAGPGRVHQTPSEIIVPPPEFVVQDEDDLSLDQITLADSLLVQQSPVRVLQEARHRYNTAITSLAEADTTSARTAIDEVLSLMVVLNDVQAPTITEWRKALLGQINQFILDIQNGQQAPIEIKGVVPRVLNGSVRKNIKRYTGSNNNGLHAAYARSGLYGDMIRNELALKGMPQELQWLPVVESAFKPRAYSWADAVGMWQFIYETGKRYIFVTPTFSVTHND